MPLNIASAKLLQDAVQNFSQDALKRREMEIAAQQGAQRIALEEANRRIQEARYNAQQEHWAKAESSQQQAEQIRADNESKQIKAVQDKYNLEAQFGNLDQARQAGNALHNKVVQMAQDVQAGKMTPEAFTGYLNQALGAYPELSKKMQALNPDIARELAGQADFESLAKRPLVDEKTGLPAGQGGAGAGRQPDIVAIDKAATDLESQAAQSQDADEQASLLARAKVLRDAQTKLTQFAPPKEAVGYTQTENPTPQGGKQTVRTPIQPPPAALVAPRAAAPGPVQTIPPRAPIVPTTGTAPVGPPASLADQPSPSLAAPGPVPNPQVPPSIPSANPAPGMTVPAPPLPTQAHIDYLKAHPETADMFDQKFGQGASDSILQPQPSSAQ